MTYQMVNSILERLDADMPGAEAHGIATGMLCVEGRADVGNWLRELTPDEMEIDAADQALLVDLFEQTRLLLHDASDAFSFDLLLADETESLQEQAESFRSWCQGFLFGVGYAQASGTEWPGDIGEIMRDLVELTKIDTDIEGEDDEMALTEVREYVRAAVFTVKDQFMDAHPSNSH